MSIKTVRDTSTVLSVTPHNSAQKGFTVMTDEAADEAPAVAAV